MLTVSRPFTRPVHGADGGTARSRAPAVVNYFAGAGSIGCGTLFLIGVVDLR